MFGQLVSGLYLSASFAPLASAAVTVRKASHSRTGYEVEFTYFNAAAQNVTIGGGLQTLTDQFHISADASASWDPRDYKPGWFRSLGIFTDLPYVMTSDGQGNWSYTTPLPSGTYQYAFLVNCADANSCSVPDGTYVIDQDNPPFVNIPGDQVASRFQVPFDTKKQFYPPIGLDFDYSLPVPTQYRGSIQTVNYTSPGSIHPAANVHDFSLYLPREYSNISNFTNSNGTNGYPLLYLSHGGGGNGQDWENLAAVSNILDRLIFEKNMEPTVVVMPSFYNIEAAYPFSYENRSGSVSPPASVVRENFMQYLFPWVETHYNVATTPDRRAFSGLSLGSVLTYEMFINATDYFNYFGFFSGALGPGVDISAYINQTMVDDNPQFLEKGLYTGFGLYDIAFPDMRLLQTAFNDARVPYVGRVVPFGFHYWNTWADCLWNFGQQALWKQLPLIPTEVFVFP